MAYSHDIGDVQESDGTLAMVATGNDPFFLLNQRGGIISSRYNDMEMDVEVSASTRMQLFFFAVPPASAEEKSGSSPVLEGRWIARLARDASILYQSDVFPVAAGRQTLRLALDQLRWSAVQPASESEATTQWGGPNHGVVLLRLDPADRAGIQIRIHRLALMAREIPAALGDLHKSANTRAAVDTQHFVAQLDQLAASNVAGDLMVLHDSGWQWQQAVRGRFRAIKRLAPDAIVFPDTEPLSVQDLQNAENTSVTWPLQAWRNTVYGLAVAVSVFLLVSIWATRHRRPLKGGIVMMEVVALLALLFCIWWIACHDQLYMLILALPAFAITCVHLLRQQSGSTREILGLHVPSAQMWRETALLSVVIVCLCSVSFLFGAKVSPVSKQALWAGFLLYPLWGLLQQFFMGPMLAATLARIVHDRPEYYAEWAIFTAAIFALLHYPNQQLMLVTLFTGSAWSWLYLRHRSIIPLAISHGILGTLYFQLSPDFLRPDGNVGLQYFDWLR